MLLTPPLIATRDTVKEEGCWLAMQGEAPIGACCGAVVQIVVGNDGAGQLGAIFDMVLFASIMLVWNILIAASPVDVDITPGPASGVRAKQRLHKPKLTKLHTHNTIAYPYSRQFQFSPPIK